MFSGRRTMSTLNVVRTCICWWRRGRRRRRRSWGERRFLGAVLRTWRGTGLGGRRGVLPLLLLIVRLPILSFRKFSGAYLERFGAGCVRSRVCRAAERRLRRISRGESAFTLGGYHFVGCERRRPCRFKFDDRRFPRSERSCRRRLFLGHLLGRRWF